MTYFKRINSYSIPIPIRHVFIFLAITLYCFHILRNVYELYAIVPPIFCLFSNIYYILSLKRRFDRDGVVILGIFVFISLSPIVYSFFWYPDESYLNPLIRFLYLFPFFAFCVLAIDSRHLICFALKIYSVFIVFSALSLLYQVFFGPISWFTYFSEREGLIRFSSLMGSLTSYGIFSIFCIPVILFIFNNFWLKLTMLFLVVLGCLVSLQKAAIINLIIFSFLCFIFEGKLIKFKIIKIYFFGFFLLLISYILDIKYIVRTVDNVVRLRDGSGKSDVNVYQSIIDRMWELPSNLYATHGWEGMIWGVGLVGGSGTLGFSEYPMSHNGFFDLLFLGGFFYLCAFCFIVLFVFFRIFSFKKIITSDRLSKSAFYIIILFILNFAFSGAIFYHPYGGIVFYLLISYFCLYCNELNCRIKEKYVL